jgi:hypothetical protein
VDDKREADERTDEARCGAEDVGESAGSALVGEHDRIIGTNREGLDHVDEVGVEAAGPSPAAIAAEGERLRILRETMIRRREMQ